MNFEDRFVTADAFANAWQDYFLEIQDRKLVMLLRARLDGAPRNPTQAIECVLNDPRGKRPRRFEMKTEILALLSGATKSVTVAMAYLGDKDVTAALVAACRKGVSVRLLIPHRANVQHDLNFRVASELRDAGVKVFLCKKMLHAKVLLIDDKIVLLGSANLNRQAMSRVGELDIYATDKRVVGLVVKELRRQFSLAVPAKDLSYRGFSAWLEGFVG